MNQRQSIRSLSAGLISLSVAHVSADQKSGDVRLPVKAARRDGNIGSKTAKSRPTSIEIRPCVIRATMKAVALKARSCDRSAVVIAGSAAAASKLMGYQMLR